MSAIKRFFKRNSNSLPAKIIGGFGLSLYRFSENRNHDHTCNGELMVLEKIAKTNPKLIIDGGANIGKYCKLISQKLPNTNIIAFEPVENTFEKLKQNVGDLKNIELVHRGLFSKECTMEINLFSSDTHSTLYELEGVKYSADKKTKINLITGDSYLEQHNIEKVDFLKIDVEGAEYDVLLGLENALKKGVIKVIQFEYGYINISSRKLLVDFYTLLESHNYVLGKIYPKRVDFRKYLTKHEDFIGPNFIAVHKDEKELIRSLGQA